MAEVYNYERKPTTSANTRGASGKEKHYDISEHYSYVTIMMSQNM